MEFINGIKNTILNTRKSFERFPITIIMSTILTLLLIYQVEVSYDIAQEMRENLMRITMTVGLGIMLSLCIGLLNERFIKSNKVRLGNYIVGSFLLVLYYNLLLKEFNMVAMTRYIGTVVFLVIVFFYALKLKHDNNYEQYVIKVFSGFFITALYSAILFFGLIAILFTIENLFEINFKSNLYLYMFFIVVFIFGVSLFLSKIPGKDEEFKFNEYSKSLKVLLLYIVIPLITAYTIILYAYFIKILITWAWPKGLVSHLVLWYSVISVGVIFLITPILEGNKLAKTFKVFFPKLILPILVMMFMSIWQRIEQYGVTENRYYVVVLGLWVLGIMIYFNFKNPLRNIVIPISLSIVVLLSIFGPLSSYSISKSSQNNRLNKLLEENNLIENGILKSNPNVDSNVQREISNIISYFHSNHDLDDITVFPDDYEIEDTKNLLGFDYNPYLNIIAERDYFNYFINPNGLVIDVEGYEHYVNMSSWNTDAINIGNNIEVRYETDHILKVEVVGKDIESIDIEELAEKIHNEVVVEPNKSMVDKKDMTIDFEDENIRLRLIFTNLNGSIDINSKEFQLQNADFILLIHLNK